MQSFDIVKKSQPSKSFRVSSVMGSYNLQDNKITEHFKGEIDLPEKWNVGLIVGKSGTGKTTIAKELFGKYIVDNFEYTHDNVLDDMPKGVSVSDIEKIFTSVGFSSVPCWLKPYDVLSNGEKMRVDLARGILENKDIIAFDEYTSVVDRNVAKVGSLALQKAIRKKDKKFIAITCHFDVQEWLMPDWVFNTDDMTFKTFNFESQKKNKPRLELQFYKTDRKEYYWNQFRKYHYLDSNLHKGAQCYLCTCNGQLAGFIGLLSFPHPKLHNVRRISRMVIFPDYQGVGIATAFSRWLALYYKDKGLQLIINTSNPAVIYSYKKSKDWIMTRVGRVTGNNKKSMACFNKTKSCNRITASFKFVGNKDK